VPVTEQCQDVVKEECPPNAPSCTMCWSGANCPAQAPFCCGTPGGVLSCSSNAAACDGFAKPAQCPDERPIACSVGDDALCCSESKPYCCSNGECYATPSECAANVAEVCLESDFPVNCGFACCPTSHPFCCEGESEVGCLADPHFCGVIHGSVN
jgi:hypothetical protein